MNIQELIEDLQKVKSKYGDIDLLYLAHTDFFFGIKDLCKDTKVEFRKPTVDDDTVLYLHFSAFGSNDGGLPK